MMEQQRHRTALSPKNSMLVPYADRQLAVAPSFASLPPGWAVQQVPRRDGSHSDKYYYEPGSGRKFRSIREVHRYLNGEEYNPSRRRTDTRGILPLSRVDEDRVVVFVCPTFNRSQVKQTPGHRWMIVSGGKLWRLNQEVSNNQLMMVASGKPVRSAPYILPDGWIVEDVRRRHDHLVDKYYYEPETGQRFRSLVAVERYLSELEENENTPLSKTLEEIMENKPLAKAFKVEYHNKSSSPGKKTVSKKNTEGSSFLGPPMKVNWVLASPQGDVWNPFIAESLVPEAVKQQWTNRFMLFMKDGASNFQSSQP